MLRFNQTKHRLSWAMSGQAFVCEPWGSVEVPDEFWPACVSQGLPLGASAVMPERRAQQVIEDERIARDNDAFAAMKRRAETAEREAKEAKGALDLAQVELSDVRAALVKAEAKHAGLAAELERARADKSAAESLLSEQAKRAEDAEVKAQKAEALSAERKGELKKKTG